MLKPEAWNCIWVCHEGGQVPGAWAFCCRLYWWRVDWKQSSYEWSWYPIHDAESHAAANSQSSSSCFFCLSSLDSLGLRCLISTKFGIILAFLEIQFDSSCSLLRSSVTGILGCFTLSSYDWSSVHFCQVYFIFIILLCVYLSNVSFQKKIYLKELEKEREKGRDLICWLIPRVAVTGQGYARLKQKAGSSYAVGKGLSTPAIPAASQGSWIESGAAET